MKTNGHAFRRLVAFVRELRRLRAALGEIERLVFDPARAPDDRLVTVAALARQSRRLESGGREQFSPGRKGEVSP